MEYKSHTAVYHIRYQICSFSHTGRSYYLKWKTTCIYERFTLLASFHIQDGRSNRSEKENHKYKIFTYREEASNLTWRTAHTKDSLFL
jgi:hypothetical protein